MYISVVLLVLDSILATTYELAIRTADDDAFNYADSPGPFTITFVGESNSQAFSLDPAMSDDVGISSQNFTTDWDLGDLHKIILMAATSDAWIFDAIWLDGVMLSIPAEIFVLELEGDGPCVVSQFTGWSNDYSSWACGNILKLNFQSGYLSGPDFVFGLNTEPFCNGWHTTTGPVKAILLGTTGRSSFYLEEDFYSSSGASEMMITADIGEVYAVTLELETHDAWVFDEVWLNDVNFMLPADVITMENEEGYCLSSQFESCLDTLDIWLCTITVTLYLDYEITTAPTAFPSLKPTYSTTRPSQGPTPIPSLKPTNIPSLKPTRIPSPKPTRIPSLKPTQTPSLKPTQIPSSKPTQTPSSGPTQIPSSKPTQIPSSKPTNSSAPAARSGSESEVFSFRGLSPLVAGVAIIFCCCTCMICGASIFYMKTTHSRSKRLLLEMQECKSSMSVNMSPAHDDKSSCTESEIEIYGPTVETEIEGQVPVPEGWTNKRKF